MSAAVKSFRQPLMDRRSSEPFADAAAAWFWAVAALAARRSGAASRDVARVPRPCDPDDVIRALDLLYRTGAIRASHVRILRKWGEVGMAPDRMLPADRADLGLWNEALDRLQRSLRAKGLVEDHLFRKKVLTRLVASDYTGPSPGEVRPASSPQS